MSNAMAVSEKIALAATGLAKSRRPGKMLRMVVNQTAGKGVCVFFVIRPKRPRSGKPFHLMLNTT